MRATHIFQADTRDRRTGGEAETFKFTFAKSFSGTVRASCHAHTYSFENPHTHTRSLACSSFLLKVSRPRCTTLLSPRETQCVLYRGKRKGGRCGFAKGLWADDGGLFRAASLNRASKNLYVLCCYMCYKFLSAPPSPTLTTPLLRQPFTFVLSRNQNQANSNSPSCQTSRLSGLIPCLWLCLCTSESCAQWDRNCFPVI